MAKVNYKDAWQTLKEEKINDFIIYPNAEKLDDLLRMDKLDSTQEFSNILHDMNRSGNDDKN